MTALGFAPNYRLNGAVVTQNVLQSVKYNLCFRNYYKQYVVNKNQCG
jgi:hypothetical protein